MKPILIRWLVNNLTPDELYRWLKRWLKKGPTDRLRMEIAFLQQGRDV